jgi:hypothetical protein
MNKIIINFKSALAASAAMSRYIDWLSTNVGPRDNILSGAFPGPGGKPEWYDTWYNTKPILAAEYKRLTGDDGPKMVYEIVNGEGWHYIETCEDHIGKRTDWVATVLVEDITLATQFKLACL